MSRFFFVRRPHVDRDPSRSPHRCDDPVNGVKTGRGSVFNSYPEDPEVPFPLLYLLEKTTYSSPLRLSRQQQTTLICDVCNTKSTFNSTLRNLHSSSIPNVKVDDFGRDINLILNNLEYKTELVSKKIATIESTILNHNAVINELERGIANLTNELSKMSYKLSTFENFISSSSRVTLSKPSSSNVASNTTSSSNAALTKSSSPAYTYTSFPHNVRTSSASHNMIVKDPHRNRTTPYSRPVTSVRPQYDS